MATALEQQIHMEYERPARAEPGSSWLGLIVGHRELFDALQDEWLRPQEGGGRPLGIGRHAVPSVPEASANSISVFLWIDPRRLPRVGTLVWRAGAWTAATSAEIGDKDEAIYWPGVLPTSAIQRIAVPNAEQRARLIGLARQVSNVSLPDVEIDVLGKTPPSQVWSPPEASPEGLSVPRESDALRGAITMALWSVPRVDPWLDILVATLGNTTIDSSRVLEFTGAAWWQTPPWARSGSVPKSAGIETRLWLAAIEVLGSEPAPGARNIAKEIASLAAKQAPRSHAAVAEEWLGETTSILRADSSIDRTRSNTCPVGLALQLVLARPEPATFKRWLDDLPWLPPGVWWTAATLAGLLTGYRHLDTYFRGHARQREIVAFEALRWAGQNVDGMAPPMVLGAPSWRRHDDRIVLSWGTDEFARKPEQSRGKWFVADLSDSAMSTQAMNLAKRAGWNCIRRSLKVTDATMTVVGSGKVSTSRGADTLVVKGSVDISLPANALVEEALDEEEFRRSIAIEGSAEAIGPPEPAHPYPFKDAPEYSSRLEVREPSAAQAALWTDLGPRVTTTQVPGLAYVPNFLSEAEESEILAAIDRSEWRSDLARRVQHYGWRYDYKARRVDSTMRLGPLPSWAAELSQRLADLHLTPQVSDQVIVNEYQGKQGIAPHIDCKPCFADGIAMLSLLESWEMVFRKENGGAKLGQVLERRSVAIMTGEARYEWSHEIPKRKMERKVLRERRVSITFRKVLT